MVEIGCTKIIYYEKILFNFNVTANRINGLLW